MKRALRTLLLCSALASPSCKPDAAAPAIEPASPRAREVRVAAPSAAPDPHAAAPTPPQPSAATPTQPLPEQPAPSAALGAPSDLTSWPSVDLGACGLSLRHPATYFVSAKRTGKKPLREFELVEDTQEVRDTLAGKLAGEPPLPMVFSVYANPGNANPVKWLETREGPLVTAADVHPTEAAGMKAVFYHSTGDEAAVDGVVFGCAGKLIEARAYFYLPGSRLRQEFARVLTTVAARGGSSPSATGECSPPGLACDSPQLSVCTGKQWKCAAP